MDKSARVVVVKLRGRKVRVREHLPWREELRQYRPKPVTLVRIRALEKVA